MAAAFGACSCFMYGFFSAFFSCCCYVATAAEGKRERDGCVILE